MAASSTAHSGLRVPDLGVVHKLHRLLQLFLPPARTRAASQHAVRTTAVAAGTERGTESETGHSGGTENWTLVLVAPAMYDPHNMDYHST